MSSPRPNQQQFEDWNGSSGQRWVSDADHRDRVLAPIAEVLFEHAQPSSGDHVLDLGCGCGHTTLLAADRVGPGRAMGLDLSAPMLAVARQRAGDRTNVSFVQGDAQTHAFESTFDVVISRFGTMFYDDQVAAFTNIGAAVRPGGRLGLVTWQPFARNPWLTVPCEVLAPYGEPPEMVSGRPGPFGQSDADQVADQLQAAGWSNVDLVPVEVPMMIGATVDDATRYLTDTGMVRHVLDPLDPPTCGRALDELRRHLAAYDTGNGVVLGGAVYVVRARRRG